jgi:hypothetical protein
VGLARTPIAIKLAIERRIDEVRISGYYSGQTDVKISAVAELRSEGEEKTGRVNMYADRGLYTQFCPLPDPDYASAAVGRDQCLNLRLGSDCHCGRCIPPCLLLLQPHQPPEPIQIVFPGETNSVNINLG